MMGGQGGAGGGPRAPQGKHSGRCRRPLPAPHLLGAAWPNKPSLFGVTFDAVPTGSHTSPNPAKICAKLNQSILEMALVRFCQGDRLQGTQRSGGAMGRGGRCGGGGDPNTSEPPAASSWGRKGRRPRAPVSELPHSIGAEWLAPPSVAWPACCRSTFYRASCLSISQGSMVIRHPPMAMGAEGRW